MKPPSRLPPWAFSCIAAVGNPRRPTLRRLEKLQARLELLEDAGITASLVFIALSAVDRHDADSEFGIDGRTAQIVPGLFDTLLRITDVDGRLDYNTRYQLWDRDPEIRLYEELKAILDQKAREGAEKKLEAPNPLAPVDPAKIGAKLAVEALRPAPKPVWELHLEDMIENAQPKAACAAGKAEAAHRIVYFAQLKKNPANPNRVKVLRIAPRVRRKFTAKAVLSWSRETKVDIADFLAMRRPGMSNFDCRIALTALAAGAADAKSAQTKKNSLPADAVIAEFIGRSDSIHYVLDWRFPLEVKEVLLKLRAVKTEDGIVVKSNLSGAYDSDWGLEAVVCADRKLEVIHPTEEPLLYGIHAKRRTPFRMIPEEGAAFVPVRRERNPYSRRQMESGQASSVLVLPAAPQTSPQLPVSAPLA